MHEFNWTITLIKKENSCCYLGKNEQNKKVLIKGLGPPSHHTTHYTEYNIS